MKAKIEEILREFPEAEIESIEDTSYKHAYHGHGFIGESHFEIKLKVGEKSLWEKIKLQKAITFSLSPLYAKNLVHSISLTIIN